MTSIKTFYVDPASLNFVDEVDMHDCCPVCALYMLDTSRKVYEVPAEQKEEFDFLSITG